MVRFFVDLQPVSWGRARLGSRFGTRTSGMNSDDKVVQVLIADGVVDFQF